MEYNYKDYIKADRARYKGLGGGGILTFQKCLRKAHFATTKLTQYYWRWRLRYYRLKYGLEISYKSRIGAGLYLGHPYNITVNPNAVIGENCNLHKGVLIGQENRGHRKGAPVLGNYVWVGINAAIVGAVKIGDDVLIAPNSFVNTDVPSHSVVFGNPCIIKHREKATENYVNNTTD